MLHIGTTAPDHVSIFARLRDMLAGLTKTRRSASRRNAARRTLRLGHLDPHMLDDIGVTPAEVAAATSRSATLNGYLALKQVEAEQQARRTSRP